MESFYVVYDLTPADEGSLDYIQVGIAKKRDDHTLIYEEGAFVNTVSGVDIDENGENSQNIEVPDPEPIATIPETPEEEPDTSGLVSLFTFIIITLIILMAIVIYVMLKCDFRKKPENGK